MTVDKPPNHLLANRRTGLSANSRSPRQKNDTDWFCRLCIIGLTKCVVLFDRMGNCCEVEGAVDHWVYVQTGDRKNKLTDVNVKVILYDITGNKSPEINLPIRFKSDWERGKTDVFQVSYIM